jgi:3-deoxy-D-manno-octulosonic acid (KDO) 8-phosphate synthase
MSDAQNALRLDQLEPLLRKLMAIDAIVKAHPGQEAKTLAPTASDRRKP